MSNLLHSQGSQNSTEYSENNLQPLQEAGEHPGDDMDDPPQVGSACDQPAPVINQPKAQEPSGNTSVVAAVCPLGLQSLSLIDQLLMHREKSPIGFEKNNRFIIKNNMGQKVYSAMEANDWLSRLCCGALRPFDMIVMGNYGNHLMHLHRPLACKFCCFPCCLQRMEVLSPLGTILGVVHQEWSILCPTFAIKNARGVTLFRIEGPCCMMPCGCDIDFKIMSSEGHTQVGKISKQWTDLARELFTDRDCFGITFPMDLDVRMKAVMMGACFLIDAIFFEEEENEQYLCPLPNDPLGLACCF